MYLSENENGTGSYPEGQYLSLDSVNVFFLTLGQRNVMLPYPYFCQRIRKWPSTVDGQELWLNHAD